MTGEGEEPRQLPIEFYDDTEEPEPASAEAPVPPARRPGPARRPAPRPGRRAATGVALLLALAAALGAWWYLTRPKPPVAPPSPARAPFEVVRVITGPGTGALPRFARPLGAAFGPGGSVFVSDTENARVCVFDAAGAFVREFGRAGDTGTPRASALVMPVGIAVDASGTAYVADLRGQAVRVYAPDGRYLRDIAPPRGTTAGWRPTDVALSRYGTVVTDATGIARFSASGRFAGRITTTLTAGLDRPNGIAVSDLGTILVSDTNHARIVDLTLAGAVVWVTEGAKLMGGRIGLPRGIAAAKDGGAWVADAFAFAIARISPDGTLTAQYGGRGTAPGQFMFPNDVDAAGDLLLVTDKENDRVQVLRVRQ